MIGRCSLGGGGGASVLSRWWMSRGQDPTLRITRNRTSGCKGRFGGGAGASRVNVAGINRFNGGEEDMRA